MTTDALLASRPMLPEEIETILKWASDAAAVRPLTEEETKVRRAVFVEHCQIMSAQAARERRTSSAMA